ncbi:YitT family protein [Microbacterium fluvii]|uniref:YitT family protein n=1 Tax=Microbacterium fluvii TaxID=415215 RepID=A0ABW2HCD3_9MICO|nr:YitT family protein [Microbacterium fluvii]MCU4671028.1 YitT family protein [Microbacterium fluvii]
MTDAPEPDEAAPTGPTLVFEGQAAPHSLLEDVLGILTGTFLASLGLMLLQASASVTGGTAGLALIVDYATDLPFWLVFAIVNLPFAALAIWQKGWDFTIRSAVSIALVSGFSVVHHAFFQIAAIDPVYGTLGGNVLAGVGLLILFRHRASLGGVNVIALVLQERAGIRAGWTQMAFDVLIIVAGLLVVPWPNVILSAVGAVVLSLILALNHRPGRYIGH